MAERTVITCDDCKKEIRTYPSDKAEDYVDAGVYGVHFHIICFDELTAFEVIKLLGLDDIHLAKKNGDHEKFIYSRR